MDSLKAMHCFVRAVELGSLSSAARELGSTQPTVSKLVAALEQQLGTRLLTRGTSGLTPTEQGKRFYERAKAVLEEYGEAVAEVRGLTERPEGVLRVNVPVSLGVLRLNALLLAFMAQYPDIEVELIFNDRFVDLTEENVDLALRLGGDLPPNAIARRIATSPRYLVAAPEYLRQQAPLNSPADLSAHHFLRFAWLSSGDRLELSGPSGEKVSVTTQGRYRSNSSLAIRDGVLQGAGLCITPAWLVSDLLDSGQLVRVLPDWSGPPNEAFLIYPERRYRPLRVRLLMEYLAERIPQLPGFMA
ncbi:LysR family transcriptional regulator [Pseudomonas chlororaphis]|uniref:LysR family transcriptional regulator n=1 Tax=Pseudomonas chlororaphis TaxID=587753 RepID=UPI0003D3A37E|nr:LysR family transcriptional regulator [Pseudomonas chlororaphis]AZD27570.1 Transcriptional regulator, LysR family [Pseudomonas chlororaphis]ETD35677.1 LysR family transcriptional regulator [Pseudomonas chlororaphis subsp. aurantiaca PB-St2]QFS53169.1 LysR family transcriptional regulator [Pseudomonas chlororaphis subsp. aurantiaca]